MIGPESADSAGAVDQGLFATTHWSVVLAAADDCYRRTGYWPINGVVPAFTWQPPGSDRNGQQVASSNGLDPEAGLKEVVIGG